MRYEEWIKNEIELAKLNEASGQKGDEIEDILDGYVDSIYDSAQELALMFLSQNHSGMSAGFTRQVFNKLAKHEPLSPITGAEEEWEVHGIGGRSGGHPDMLDHQQNLRFPSVFRFRKTEDEDWQYSYNNVLKVINSDEVWETYPPTDCTGTLDDDDPTVKSYFDQMYALIDMLNRQIKFPFIAKTHKFMWNFETLKFEMVVDEQC